MNTLIPAEFHGVTLNIIDHAGKQWLTAEQAGLALGYSDGNARVGVLNLYNRHRDEFEDGDKGVIELMTPGGLQKATVFSLSGCHLLGMFANTPRAKAFRLWVKRVLAGQSARPPAPVQKTTNGRKLVTRRIEREVFELFVAGYTQKQMADAMQLSRATINLLIHGKYQFSPLAGAPECSPELVAAVIERHRQIVHERFVAEQQRVANRFLCDANNQSLAQGLNEIGRAHLVALADALTGSQMAVLQ